MPAVRKIVPKFMVGGGLRLKMGRRKGERFGIGSQLWAYSEQVGEK